MDISIPHSSHQLTIKHAGQAIECGTLSVLLDAIVQQQVLVMPLTRTMQQGLLTIHQWAVHVTTRYSVNDPVYYATLRAAEVIQQPTSTALAFPYPSRDHAIDQARKLTEELSCCVKQLLSQSARVN